MFPSELMSRSAEERAAIRRRYKLLRLGVDLTQLDTAIAADIAHGRYRKIEGGYFLPTTEERARLATLFKVPPAEVSPDTADDRAPTTSSEALSA